MAKRRSLKDYASALLGVSAYQPARGYGPDLDDKVVEQIREAVGGNIQPIPTTKLRWYLKDLEDAQSEADTGVMRMSARLYRAMRRDGVLAGLLSTRTSGLVRLPKRFYGPENIQNALKAKNGSRSVFDEMFPPSELALLDADGIALGVGVAEMVPVPGRDYPVMVRLEPEFLVYRWQENRWYLQSLAGLLPITPGDGRWILHVPGGRMSPWHFGLWPALGRSWINKEHALLHRSNYSGKLANPARVAEAPAGATEAQRQGFIKRLMAWGTNTVFELPPGWQAKLLESNGRGIEVFQEEIDTCDQEFMVALAGQVVTTTGGSGFVSGPLFKTIRQDLVKSDADALAYTISTQGLPVFVVTRFGEDAIESGTALEWDTDEPKDRATEAGTMATLGGAIAAMNAALAASDHQLDINELSTRYGLPLKKGKAEMPEAPAPKASISPIRTDERKAA